jgi:hypothetical protein
MKFQAIANDFSVPIAQKSRAFLSELCRDRNSMHTQIQRVVLIPLVFCLVFVFGED